MADFRWRAAILPVLLASAAGACARERAATLFVPVPPAESGVSFANELPADSASAFNIITYLYYYNGGGVAAGDVNGDGLPDLFFTSNLGVDRLYLNRGNYHFEDVTDRAGVGRTPGWTTGAAMADVNGDGLLDIYVSSVSYGPMQGRNALYINQGDGTFKEEAARYGLDFSGYSTQALFFDYDGDGDLDMYLLNSSVHEERGPMSGPQRQAHHPRAGDRLYRNDGGHFTDVSARAGIYGGVEGYGLGVVATDVNGDGCPDLYVANDFQENDFLYVNNCDGTFTESVATAMAHTSKFAMGVDAADFDNDLRPDLVVADMLPERLAIRNTAAGTESWELLQARTRAGYHPQFSRNTLQLNRGGTRFSDIAYLAGVAATDWSWAPLFADLDNDGWKDLFITSGIWRRPNDLDYIEYVSRPEVQAQLARDLSGSAASLAARMPHVPEPNHAFRNNGNLTFTDAADAWGLGRAGFSNGAVYVDLNRTGQLDLVVNNLNAPASIYRNRAREVNGNHYLSVSLVGEGANTGGIGARVIAAHGGRRQMLEEMPARGFESSVDPVLHFGLGASTTVDSLVVIWPDRRFQVLRDVKADQRLVVHQRDATGRYAPAPRTGPPMLSDVTATARLDFRHAENDFVDFEREPLMPHRLSTEGPALAVGDVNGDGLDDVYLGGAKWQPGRLYIQQRDGRFVPSPQPAISADSLAEDVDATFFDADGDGHPDLYVVSAGNEFSGQNDDALLDRLYRNDGHGHFVRDTAALPPLHDNGSCVVAADFDGDGDIDLFVGSRVVAGRYGIAPASHLLVNDGHGHFRDATAELAPALASAGMVTSAAWTDVDGDGRLDLVVVGEWMPVRVFLQRNGRFTEATADLGLAQARGWWNSVVAADVNGDGRPDLVLGNLGLNSSLQASATHPARLYVGDFDGNGTIEQVLTTWRDGGEFPVAGRDELLRAMPSLRARFPTYASFGAPRLDDIVPRSARAGALVLEATTFASAVALNEGGRFRLDTLPVEAQFAPVYASLVADLDGDGRADLLLAGNESGVPPYIGGYDASDGLVLRSGGAGRWLPVDETASGVRIAGEVRHIRAVRTARGRAIVIARNNDLPLVLKVR